MFNKKIFNNDPVFANQNRNILNRKKGAGYWLWKPYILLRELNVARDGDIIIYSDAAVNFVANVSYLTNLTANQDVVVFELLGGKVRYTNSRNIADRIQTKMLNKMRFLRVP
jgi:hypothetical protein